MATVLRSVLVLAVVQMMLAAERPASAQQPPWTRPPGFTTTEGGEGGGTVVVDTLAAEGSGSLAEAISAKGPRKIVFSVGGAINLRGACLKISDEAVTIAGETAPSPGITIVDGGVAVTGHDVVIRHIRVRPGATGHEGGSGWDIDALATISAHDVIIDHCSLSWATDENLSASGPRFEGDDAEGWRNGTSRRITFSHCLVGEGLNKSVHTKGLAHSMGSLIHDNVSEMTIVGNLYISNNARNPLFKGGARGVVVNNLIHNPGGAAITFGLVPGEWSGHEWARGQMAIVGNVVRRGPSSSGKLPAIRFGGGWGVPECDAYMHDNLLLDHDGKPVEKILEVNGRATDDENGKTGPDSPTGTFREVDQPPLWPSGLEARPAEQTAEWVLADVGARPWDRDAVDRRLIEEARTGGGKLIDHEREVAGK